MPRERLDLWPFFLSLPGQPADPFPITTSGSCCGFPSDFLTSPGKKGGISFPGLTGSREPGHPDCVSVGHIGLGGWLVLGQGGLLH